MNKTKPKHLSTTERGDVVNKLRGLPPTTIQSIVKEAAIDSRTSFSAASWDKTIKQLGLDPSKPIELLCPKAPLPTALLPKSFHLELLEAAAKSLEFYGPIRLQSEASKVRSLEPYIVAVGSLFFSHIRNFAEEVVGARALTTGGSIEHECKGFNGLWCCILEMKARLNNQSAHERDCCAQLLLELHGSHAESSKHGVNNNRIYGILTDRQTYYVFSYDGTTFLYHGDLNVSHVAADHLVGMIPVTEMIFGILLESFEEVLKGMRDESVARAASKSSDPHTPMPKLPPPEEPIEHLRRGAISEPMKERPSLRSWEEGLILLRKARALLCLTESAGGLVGDEHSISEGLDVLSRAVSCLPIPNDRSGGLNSDDYRNAAERKSFCLSLLQRSSHLNNRVERVTRSESGSS